MNPARVAAVSWDELLGMRIGAVLRDSDYSGATQVRSIADLEVGTEVLVAQLAALAIPPRRTLTSLRRRHGPICVVVIIPHRDSTDVARLLTAGVEGTVDEADLEASLTPTIDAARCGQVVVHPARRPRGVLRDLPRRQAQVLNLLALGFTNAEIARRLSVSENTAKSHLSALFTRLGVRSRSEAVTTLNEEVAWDSAPGLGESRELRSGRFADERR
ncbi:MAG: LuxR C-terminal-related transcriptional regulator [Solirubrobacterales bacterium]